MSNLGALLFAAGAAAIAWFFSPQVVPNVDEAWFIGAGDWDTTVFHGREIVTAVMGLVCWIAGLHVARA